MADGAMRREPSGDETERRFAADAARMLARLAFWAQAVLHWAALAWFAVAVGAVLRAALAAALLAILLTAPKTVSAQSASPPLELKPSAPIADLAARLEQIEKRVYAAAVEGVDAPPSETLCQRSDLSLMILMDAPSRRRPIDKTIFDAPRPLECWYRVEVVNNDWRHRVWRVESALGRVSDATVHLRRHNGGVRVDALEPGTPRFGLAARERATLYFKTIGEADDLRLTPHDAATRGAMGFSAWRVGHLAAAAAMLAFFISFALVLRARPALWYAGFFAALIVAQAQSSVFFIGTFADDALLRGVHSGFFWLYRSRSLALTELVLILAYIGFVVAFLQARTRHPALWRAAMVLAALAVVATVYGLQSRGVYTGVSIGALALSHAVAAIFVALGAWAAIEALRAQREGAWLFAIGAAVLSTNLLANIVSAEFPGPWTPWVRFLTPSLHVLDGAVFAAAIVRRTFALRHARDAALVAELDAARARAKTAAALVKAQDARDEAMRLAERRRARMASAGRDLRAPLSALRHNLERAEANAPELGQVLGAALAHLDGVLDGALSEAGDEAGREPPERTPETEPLPAQLILDNVARMFAAEAEAKGLALRVAPSSAAVATEPVALIRVLSNLVSNAVKYTRTGRILVGARRRNGRLAFEVWDQGPGMDAAELARVLQPYQRGAASTGVAGEGLGLVSAQREAARLGLSLEAASRPGRGAVFRVAGLPLVDARAPTPHAVTLH